MAILKNKITKDFTAVHNKFLRDHRLSINARGLLMTMLSMNENWNFSIKGLAGILPDGERKISSTLIELEERGYLIRMRKYKNGKIVDWEYTFSDEPIINGGKSVESFVSPPRYGTRKNACSCLWCRAAKPTSAKCRCRK